MWRPLCTWNMYYPSPSAITHPVLNVFIFLLRNTTRLALRALADNQHMAQSQAPSISPERSQLHSYSDTEEMPQREYTI